MARPIKMQLVDPFIWGRLRMKMERRFPTRPKIPTPLSRQPGRKNSKKKLSSSAGGKDTVWREESEDELPSSSAAGTPGREWLALKDVVLIKGVRAIIVGAGLVSIPLFLFYFDLVFFISELDHVGIA